MTQRTQLLSLLFLGFGACAAQERDAPAPGAVEASCPVPTESACLDDDNGACCTRVAIKYEYEMLDAHERGDRSAYTSNRDMLAKLLDHGCELGSDDACAQLDRLAAPQE
ncbi:MAG TPA: hypothetical protein VG755_11710 [Nannocystaceae bacterium]|nr:hypothetical protein [Nannocystaceae bacterium]